MIKVENREDSTKVAYVQTYEDFYEVRFHSEDRELPETSQHETFHEAVGEAAYLVGDEEFDTRQLELSL